MNKILIVFFLLTSFLNSFAAPSDPVKVTVIMSPFESGTAGATVQVFNTPYPVQNPDIGTWNPGQYWANNDTFVIPAYQVQAPFYVMVYGPKYGVQLPVNLDGASYSFLAARNYTNIFIYCLYGNPFTDPNAEADCGAGNYNDLKHYEEISKNIRQNR